MLWRLGTALLVCSAILLAAWGISTAILVQGWNPMGAEVVSQGFQFLGAVFRMPAWLCAGTGLLCILVGLVPVKQPD